MKISIFPGKYHQNGGFSMASLVSAERQQVAINCLDQNVPLDFGPIPLENFQVLLMQGDH